MAKCIPSLFRQKTYLSDTDLLLTHYTIYLIQEIDK